MIDSSNYESLFSLLSSIQNNDRQDDLVINILEFVAEITNSDGYFLFKISPSKYINLEHIKIKSIHLTANGVSCDKLYQPSYIPDIKNKELKKPSDVCAAFKEIINSPNIYNETIFDTSHFKKFDLEYNYNSVSLLAFPLSDSNGNVISVVQLLNAQTPSGKIINFPQALQEKVVSICQLISVVLERQQQNNTYNKFLESFVSTLAKIVLSKTPHIASHNNHVPLIAQRLAVAISTSSDKPFKNFEMTDSQWNVLNIASWIYDCGKIMAPDHILNKSSKLETVYNRIHEIRQRFEILWRDAHIEYLQKRLNNIADKETLQAEFVEKIKKLHDDFEFVGMCNNDNIELKKEDISRLDEIASQTFTRYFNKTTGLSPVELQNIDTNISSQSQTEYLLQDLPEQTSNSYNTGELSNLKTKNGILNPTERKKILEYALNTSNLLIDIPFPPEYSNIPEIITSHEKSMKGLTPLQEDFSQTTIIAKILSLATIFASLISKESPCAKNKKLSKIMKIMQKMKNDGIIDARLYDIFIRNDIYIDYAKEYLDASQIDEINIEEII